MLKGFRLECHGSQTGAVSIKLINAVCFQTITGHVFIYSHFLHLVAERVKIYRHDTSEEQNVTEREYLCFWFFIQISYKFKSLFLYQFEENTVSVQTFGASSSFLGVSPCQLVFTLAYGQIKTSQPKCKYLRLGYSAF